MRDEAQRLRTEKILAESQRLIAQVDAALAEGRRVMESRGWTREYIQAETRRMPARLRKRLQSELDEALDKARAIQSHSPGKFGGMQIDVTPPDGGLKRLRRASRLV